MSKKIELTPDRRPLYQITDPATRELRYREAYYETLRRASFYEREFFKVAKWLVQTGQADGEQLSYIEQMTGMTHAQIQEWAHEGS